MTPRDRCFAVGFSERPALLMPLTSDARGDRRLVPRPPGDGRDRRSTTRSSSRSTSCAACAGGGRWCCSRTATTPRAWFRGRTCSTYAQRAASRSTPSASTSAPASIGIREQARDARRGDRRARAVRRQGERARRRLRPDRARAAQPVLPRVRARPAAARGRAPRDRAQGERRPSRPHRARLHGGIVTRARRDPPCAAPDRRRGLGARCRGSPRARAREAQPRLHRPGGRARAARARAGDGPPLLAAAGRLGARPPGSADAARRRPGRGHARARAAGQGRARRRRRLSPATFRGWPTR